MKAGQLAAAAVLISLAVSVSQGSPWLHQISVGDVGGDVVVDSGGNLLFAYTGLNAPDGSLPTHGSTDNYIVKYDAFGNQLGVTQLGSTRQDNSLRMAVDAGGNLYAGASTWGSFGPPNLGWEDCVLVKYDAAGQQQWLQQWGSAQGDGVTGLAFTPSGSVVVSGYLGTTAANNYVDWQVQQYSPSGTLEWSKTFHRGVNYEFARDVTVAADGSILVCGDYQTPAGYLTWDSHACMVKLDADGNLIWQSEFSTSTTDKLNQLVIADDGSIYAAGRSNKYGLLAKYDAAGNLVWKKTPALNVDDFRSILIDGDNNLILAGGNTIAKYDLDGTELATTHIGLESFTTVDNIALAPSGEVYASGWTYVALEGGAPPMGRDAFVARVPFGVNIPEPMTLTLLAAAALPLLRRRMQHPAQIL